MTKLLVRFWLPGFTFIAQCACTPLTCGAHLILLVKQIFLWKRMTLKFSPVM